jgi:hypothetical protein
MLQVGVLQVPFQQFALLHFPVFQNLVHAGAGKFVQPLPHAL